MPVRNVSNRGGNIIGYFPSIKMGRMVAFESTIERDLIYLLDYESHVASFSEQPMRITYLDEGLTRTYTPDFQVEFANGRQIIVECKPEALMNLDENQRKFEAGQAWAKEHSWEYKIITDKGLRDGHRLENIKFLTQHARHSIPSTTKLQILQTIDSFCGSGSSLQVAYTVSSVEPSPVLTAIFQMVFYHELTMALNDEKIDTDTLVRKLSPGENHDEYTSLFG